MNDVDLKSLMCRIDAGLMKAMDQSGRNVLVKLEDQQALCQHVRSLQTELTVRTESARRALDDAQIQHSLVVHDRDRLRAALLLMLDIQDGALVRMQLLQLRNTIKSHDLGQSTDTVRTALVAIAALLGEGA